MINIAICEDELFFRDRLLKLLKEYFEQVGLQYSLDTYQTGEQVLEADYNAYDILCLDVEIKNGMSGIELAKQLRKRNNTGQIIFITSHQEEAYKAFEVDTFRYLIKPIVKEILYQALDAVLQKIRTLQKQKIILKTGPNFIQLQIAEILYIETIGRKIRVCTFQKDYFSENKLKELEDQLSNSDFFRVHKSYLVHLAYIKEHDNNSITMQNGDQVFISRLKLSHFKNKFIAYLRREKGVGNC